MCAARQDLWCKDLAPHQTSTEQAYETGVQLVCAARQDLWCKDLAPHQTSTEQAYCRTTPGCCKTRLMVQGPGTSPNKHRTSVLSHNSWVLQDKTYGARTWHLTKQAQNKRTVAQLLGAARQDLWCKDLAPHQTSTEQAYCRTTPGCCKTRLMVQGPGTSPNKHRTSVLSHSATWKAVCSTSHTMTEGPIWVRKRTKAIDIISNVKIMKCC